MENVEDVKEQAESQAEQTLYTEEDFKMKLEEETKLFAKNYEINAYLKDAGLDAEILNIVKHDNLEELKANIGFLQNALNFKGIKGLKLKEINMPVPGKSTGRPMPHRDALREAFALYDE